MSDLVTLSKSGTVAIVEINNPPVNALGQAVRKGLLDAVKQAEADPEVTAIVIIGAGRTFPAGADIKEFGRPMEDPHLPDVIDQIENCAKPVVAALHGTALGGGFEIALGCPKFTWGSSPALVEPNACHGFVGQKWPVVSCLKAPQSAPKPPMPLALLIVSLSQIF